MNREILLLSLFFCHFLADYTHLSTNWMLNAKRTGYPLLPILCHAGVHALLMFIVCEIVKIPAYIAFKMVLFQLSTHFIIDTWKGRMNVWFPALQSPANKWHWVVFGFDQFLHASVIIYMVHLLK